MEYEMRILKPSDIRKDIVAFFRSESLVPIVGAGLSCNVPTLRGKVPSGTTYKEHMLQALLKNSQFTPEEHDQLKSEKFSTLCDYYEDDENVSAEERLSYLKENFFNAKFDAMDMRRKFFEIQWPYIYSLNIDDAIENSSQYNTIILPNREFRDDLFTEERCLIKLHGDIREIVALDEEISVSVKRYAPFIERSETALFEKDPSDLSRIKYSLNSKYWLQRELGTYARVEGCKESVAGAYRYIIQKILDFSGSNLFLRRRLSRNFIMFDVMNGTFLDEHGGNLSIIVYIYTKLHEYLATDYHFLHQEAKCYMYYSYSLDDTESKKKYLNDAKQLALVSKSMIENQNETSPNERLMISIAHVQYTIATILSDLSRINEFTDEVLLKESIDAVYEALKSPYNDDDYLRERKQRASRGVVNFLKYFTTNTGRMKEYPDYHQKVSDLVNIYLTGKQLKSRS